MNTPVPWRPAPAKSLIRVVRVIEYIGTPEDVARQLDGSMPDGTYPLLTTITVTTVKTSAEAVAAFGGQMKG